MNLSLIDPFILAQDYPDSFTEKLRMCCLNSCNLAVITNVFEQEVAMRPVYDLIARATT